MRKRLKALIRKNLILYSLSSFIYYQVLKLIYFFYKIMNPMKEKAVLFISFMGEQYSDNPRALYEYMLSKKEYSGFSYYWVFKEPAKFKLYEKLKGAKLVRYGSGAYYKACASSKYWISNARMKNELSKKKGQIYLQTWHGTPLKKLGYDIEVENFKDIGGDLKNLIKNYSLDAKRYDYMLSVSKFYSEHIGSAFGLDRIGKRDIFLEYGYPRNDLLFQYDEGLRASVREELGLNGKRKVILYAPTFREADIGASGYEHCLKPDLKRFKKELGGEYQILLRLHYYISKSLDLSDLEGFVYDVSSYADISYLYLISDMLITDYSSVFFDYANLKRPIIFYMYDLKEYNRFMHDFYLGLEELPGPIVYDEDGLLEAIKEADRINYDFEGFNQRFNPHREAASGKVIETVIRL